MTTIHYVRFGCNTPRSNGLCKAQDNTCLMNQHVITLGDGSNGGSVQLDMDLRLNSLPGKFLRWLAIVEPSQPDWWMFIDYDSWIFTSSVNRVTDQLRTDQPVICGLQTRPTFIIDNKTERGGFKTVYGPAMLNEAAAWINSAPCAILHGGAGILMNSVMLSEIRKVALNGVTKCSCSKKDNNNKSVVDCPFCKQINVEINNVFTGQPSKISVLFYDAVISYLVSRLDCNFDKRIVTSSLILDKENHLRLPIDNTWCAEGNGMGHIKPPNYHFDKEVCDFNVSHPKNAMMQFDVSKAKSLLTSNTNPQSKKRRQHIIPGQANLMTYHKFKYPEMFYLLQAELDR